MSTPVPRCRLLGLPAEIRELIYSFTFLQAPNDHADREAQRPALLQTCRLVHNESLDFLLNATTRITLSLDSLFPRSSRFDTVPVPAICAEQYPSRPIYYHLPNDQVDTAGVRIIKLMKKLLNLDTIELRDCQYYYTGWIGFLSIWDPIAKRELGHATSVRWKSTGDDRDGVTVLFKVPVGEGRSESEQWKKQPGLISRFDW